MNECNEYLDIYNEGRLVMLESIIQDFYLQLRLNHTESMKDCVHGLGKFYYLDTKNTCLNSTGNYIQKAGYFTSRIDYEKS